MNNRGFVLFFLLAVLAIGTIAACRHCRRHPAPVPPTMQERQRAWQEMMANRDGRQYIQ